ncbi:expressed unknown protein [Seminavis robusta]|uniref:5-carboxymethyl-2-hydroxymuconate isomerase n=1 Tax=Seminavis robusta TaxID=568900 RepID=A0A9N8DFI1_9STRA|nr:expressed unknown protein [Seminavis robusta]|eukprot:Sro64_g036330.1 n/a (129) ;mRNA; r:80726-81112
MPHFVLEYSPQAKELLPAEIKDDWKPLFKKFHGIMNDQGIAPAPKCKSRAYLADNFLLGEDEEAGMVHLSVAFLDLPEPLTKEKLRSLGDTLKATMVEFFGGAGKTGKVEFSVELRLMPKEMYWRNGD